MRDVFFWVNACVVRKDSDVRRNTILSLRNSDIPSFEVWMHDPAEQKFKDWLIEKLLLAASKAEFFVRFEDDIEVNKNIMHNISTWSALDEPDFGMGLLYVNKSIIDPRGWHMLARSPKGELKRRYRWTEGAQAQIFKSSLMPAILENFNKEIETMGHQCCLDPDYCIPDFSVSTGVYELGKSVYIHSPSLVQHNGIVSAFSNGQTAKDPILARNYDPDWKRPEEKRRHKARRQ